uniref:Kelch repeat-containing protein n=1 Tax=Hucho hucho TaxID=62062 RepID=A0A4W5N8I8_9TELE
MDDFGVYVVLGVNDAPLNANGSAQFSVAVPPSSQQVVMFSRGRWGDRICVNAELNDADRVPITIGKLTPYNRYERFPGPGHVQENTSSRNAKGDMMDPDLTLSMKEYTPESTMAPSPVREGKRKRGQTGEEDEEENRGKENTCPNEVASFSENSTPLRKVRGQTRGGQTRLFLQGEGQGGTALTPQNTPPQRGKGRQAKTPTTQTAPLVNPSGRWGQSLCPIDPQTAILIGGQGSRMQFCKDPMWKLCTEDMSWVPAETLAEGPTPEARIGHTATYDPDSKRIFVFGGSKNKKWFNDVHILDTQSWKWSTVEAQGKVPPLAYHSCSMFRGELFVLGGVFPRPHPEPDGCSDSLYIFDPHLSIWYQPIVTGDRPAPRSGHSACVIQGKIYVFGGWDTPLCFNDMYMLDLGLMEFSSVQTNGSPPSPRSWHGCVLLSDSTFVVHGGYNGNQALNDTFTFNTDTNTWTELVHPQLSVPRAGHSIITMALANQNLSFKDDGNERNSDRTPKTLLVFGGGDNEGNFYSDLTTLTVAELLDQN